MALSTALLLVFAVFFWIMRVIIALMTQAGIDLMGLEIQNLTIEIVLIFITVLSLILIAKRKLVGSAIYLATYGYYFGADILNRVTLALQNGMGMEDIINIVVSAFGILLAIFIFLDAIILKAKKGKTTNQKTDWFFNNEQFDRKFDERADRNEYKF